MKQKEKPFDWIFRISVRKDCRVRFSDLIDALHFYSEHADVKVIRLFSNVEMN